MSATISSHEPLSSLNITPLIDVLLVLIVMFILCLPMATNELPIDLPSGPSPASDAPVHRLTIDREGAVSWDGGMIGAVVLDSHLRAAAASGGRVSFAPDPRTPFAPVERLLATVKRAGVTRLGFEGNERYRAF